MPSKYSQLISNYRVAIGIIVLLAIAGTVALVLTAKPTQNGPRSPQTQTDPNAENTAPDTQPQLAAYVPPSTEGYVGSQTCARCHAEIAESYAAHPMARSVKPAGDMPLHSPATADIPGKSRLYHVSFQDGKILHHDRMFDKDEQLIYDQAVAMDYVVGSGQRALAYLHRQGDLLFQSPLNWYTQTEKWDLAPGYAPDDPRRFRRRVTDDCMACHTGRVDASTRGLNRFHESSFLEMGIGCENCHGPGADHVAFHESAGDITQSIDPIVNPARLTHAAQQSICSQCHLNADARITRPGRSHLDFRPGMLLEDIWTVLDAGVNVSESGASKTVNHVQQMTSSVCYASSQPKMTCTSCHNPHSHPAEDQRQDYYRKRCLTCHQSDDCSTDHTARDAVSDSCIDCHMPNRGSSNISHVSQTDHRILRSYDSEENNTRSSSTLVFMDNMHQRLPDWEASRAMGAAAWIHLGKQGQQAPASLADLLVPALQHVPNDAGALTVLGSLARQHGRLELAAHYLEQALQTPEGEESAVSGLLDIHYLSGNWQKAAELAEHAIRLDPSNPGFHAIKADALIHLGKLDEAIQAGEKALELNPSLTDVRQWLVDAYRTAGDTAKHQSAAETLERVRSAKIPQQYQPAPSPAE